MRQTNWSFPEPIEARRNCHTRQARLVRVVGRHVVDALRNHAPSKTLEQWRRGVVETTIKNDVTLVETINIGIYLARGSILIGLTMAVHKSRHSKYKNLTRPSQLNDHNCLCSWKCPTKRGNVDLSGATYLKGLYFVALRLIICWGSSQCALTQNHHFG